MMAVPFRMFWGGFGAVGGLSWFTVAAPSRVPFTEMTCPRIGELENVSVKLPSLGAVPVTPTRSAIGSKQAEPLTWRVPVIALPLCIKAPLADAPPGSGIPQLPGTIVRCAPDWVLGMEPPPHPDSNSTNSPTTEKTLMHSGVRWSR